MGHVPLGLFMLFLAAVDGWAGVEMGLIGIPFVWCSISLILTGLAYTAGRPLWLGKRPDGSVWRLATVANFPFIVVAHLAAGARRFGPEPAWSPITPGLFLGRRVRARELPPGIGLVVDLTAEFSAPADVRAQPYRTLPTLDGCAPDPGLLANLLREVSTHPGPVYVHCAVGHGRSAMFAAGLLILRGEAASIDEAEAKLRSRRPRVEIKPTQREALEAALRR